MTLEKAIQLLHFELKTYKDIHSPDTNDAIQLSIEALKFCQKYKRMILQPTQTLLPGETED